MASFSFLYVMKEVGEAWPRPRVGRKKRVGTRTLEVVGNCASLEAAASRQASRPQGAGNCRRVPRPDLAASRFALDT